MRSFRYLIIVDFKILIYIKMTKSVYRKQNCRRVANFMSQLPGYDASPTWAIDC